MIAATESLALPVTPLRTDFDASVCYGAGDSFSLWLNEKSNNPATQHEKTEILNRLAAGGYSAQTRMDIGDCENTSLEVLLMLAADENPDVRFAVAENHNINESVLSMLTEDSHPYVAHRAQKTLARLKGPAVAVDIQFSLTERTAIPQASLLWIAVA